MTTIAIRPEPRYAAIGLPLASTSRALAVPQGWSRTVTGPPAADLPEKLTVVPELMMRVEEVDGDFGVGIEPMDLEPAALHAAVVLSGATQPMLEVDGGGTRG